MLKILHVNYYDIKGGAAIGVNRLHRALLKNGVNSKILVCEKTSNDSTIIGPNNTFEILANQFKIALSRYIKRKLLTTKNKETFSFNFLNTNILKKINNHNADIVHLHWIGNEMISISQLKKINKPVIWSFWDMWPVCGAEHHSFDERYIDGYNKTNRPKNEGRLDLNRLIWNYKKKNFNFNYTVTTPSKWFYNLVKKSSLHKNKEIFHMPLNIDTTNWKPRNTDISKEFFKINNDKNILLFGSATSTNDRKGFDFLIELFKQKNFENSKLIIFGEKPKKIEQLKIEYEYIGRINDIYSLNMLYSLSKVVLMPSKIELFGQIGMEASACGTPSIIFENTGATDYVEHKKNGYLAKYLDIEDYTEGINWFLNNDFKYKEISANCHKHISNNFDDKLISKKFIDLYKKIIN